MADKGTYRDMMRFMDAAKRRMEVSTVQELAEKIGMNTPNQVRQFYKWENGEHRPRLDKVLPLMEKTGMLSNDAAAEQPPEPASDPVERLEELVDRLAALVGTIEAQAPRMRRQAS